MIVLHSECVYKIDQSVQFDKLYDKNYNISIIGGTLGKLRVSVTLGRVVNFDCRVFLRLATGFRHTYVRTQEWKRILNVKPIFGFRVLIRLRRSCKMFKHMRRCQTELIRPKANYIRPNSFDLFFQIIHLNSLATSVGKISSSFDNYVTSFPSFFFFIFVLSTVYSTLMFCTNFCWCMDSNFGSNHSANWVTTPPTCNLF